MQALIAMLKLYFSSKQKDSLLFLCVKQEQNIYLKLGLKRSACQQALNHISPIKAVHAVTAEYSFLLSHNFTIGVN